MDDWMDDVTNDGSSGFRGCFTPPAQNASYIDPLKETKNLSRYYNSTN